MSRMNRCIRRQAKQRRGYAMLLVMVIILTSTAFVALHQRHLNSALRIEQARMQSESFRTGPVTVLAVACQRLETGNPVTPTSYRYNHIENGAALIYRVDYAQSGTQWIIFAEADPKAVSLPLLPDTF